MTWETNNSLTTFNVVNVDSQFTNTNSLSDCNKIIIHDNFKAQSVTSTAMDQWKATLTC
jgi:hypothetical protein